MPALPAATVIVTASSSPGSGGSSDASLQLLPDSVSGDDATPRAFTVLDDPADAAPPLVCLCEDDDGALSWQPLNFVDYGDAVRAADDCDELCDTFGRRFRASRPDQQSVTAANIYLIQRKLMDLQTPLEQAKPDEPKRLLRANGLVRPPRGALNVKVNNLKEQKPFSKSSGHICATQPQQPAKKLRKEYSLSQSNVGTQQLPARFKKDKTTLFYSGINNTNGVYNKNLLNEKQNEVPHSKCNYHKNCLPTSPPYNMTTAVKPPNYSIDQKPTGVLGVRRRSSPNSDDSMSPFHKNNNNNNNIINLKNKQNEKNNRLNNSQNAYKTKLNNAAAPPQPTTPQKPLFVTTVKSGQFLDPPPELALLLGLAPPPSAGPGSTAASPDCASSEGDPHRQQVLLYSFSSQPRVLHQHHHRARCEAAKAARQRLQQQQQQQPATAAATQRRGAAPAAAEAADGGKAAPAPAPAPAHRQRRDVGAAERKGQAEANKQNGSDGPPYGNLMFDRRVVRGSTINSAYAQHCMPTEGESQTARQIEARRRALMRRKAHGTHARNMRFRLSTPPPVEGRTHVPVQTEKYLEELWERPPERDVGCQTDLYLERPESPIYVPAKTGKDAETQIYPGDLFDFDVEVVPILEVLVGKTVQQSMVEVLEEEELAAIRAAQRRYLELRAAEEAELRRLEEQERRLREEKDRRLRQYEEAAKMAKDTETQVAAAVLTQGYLADLLPSVLEGLKDKGLLTDSIRDDVHGNFMPWLMRQVQTEMNNMVTSRDILMEMVREILEQRAEAFRAMGEAQAARLGLDSEEDEARGEGMPRDSSWLDLGSALSAADDFIDRLANRAVGKRGSVVNQSNVEWASEEATGAADSHSDASQQTTLLLSFPGAVLIMNQSYFSIGHPTTPVTTTEGGEYTETEADTETETAP